MKKTKILLKGILGMLIITTALLLTGCSKKEDNNTNNKTISNKNDTNSYVKTEKISKISFIQNNNNEINGQIRSLVPSNDGFLVNNNNGDLYMIPSFVVGSEAEFYKITTDTKINDLVYSNTGIIYGNNRFIYYETSGEYDDSFHYTYTFNNINKFDLTNDKNLIYSSDNANFYAYVDINNNVVVNSRKDSNRQYTTYSNATFTDLDSQEKTNVKINKAIYKFILTEDNKLLYIKNGQTISTFVVETGVSIGYNDITNKINGKIIDIYNVQNSMDSCYVVNENNDIYFIENALGEIKAELITRFSYDTIEDIKGYNGKPQNMIIKAKNSKYYYSDSDGTDEISELSKDFINVALLTDNNIIALNKDGYLYSINIQN